jgi:hypothetical protein
MKSLEGAPWWMDGMTRAVHAEAMRLARQCYEKLTKKNPNGNGRYFMWMWWRWHKKHVERRTAGVNSLS